MRVAELEREWYKPTSEDFKAELDKIHLAKYRFMEVLCENATVIDCGSGGGFGSYSVAATASRVLGVDKDPEAIRWAQTLYEDDNLEYRCCDFRDVQEKFDIALCFGLMGLTRELEDMRTLLVDLDKLADVVVVDCPSLGTPIPLHYNELTLAEWESVVAIYPGRVERFRQKADRLGQDWETKCDYYIAVLSRAGEHWEDFGFTEKRKHTPAVRFSVEDALQELRDFVPS